MGKNGNWTTRRSLSRTYSALSTLCKLKENSLDMNAEEMAREILELVKSVIRHRYRQEWCFPTLWKGFEVKVPPWEPFFAFVLPEGRLNSVLVDYLSQNNLGELLRLPETLASQNKPWD